jgi:hypothetical protein
VKWARTAFCGAENRDRPFLGFVGSGLGFCERLFYVGTREKGLLTLLELWTNAGKNISRGNLPQCEISVEKWNVKKRKK